MLTRRQCLHLFIATGALSVAPSLRLLAAPGDKRLVVVILRGAMDGLDVVRPLGDANFASLRPGTEGTIDLDGFYGLHPALAPVEKLYRGHELSFIHAVATPYRERSHFDGQDVLERGIERNDTSASGWLNRVLGLLGNNKAAYAIDIGNDLVLDGPQPHNSWFPQIKLDLTAESTQFLEALYEGDPLLEASFSEVQQLAQSNDGMSNIDPGISPRELAVLAAKYLNQDARIAVFSMTGWDTHVRQAPHMPMQLGKLSNMIIQLKESLGTNWQNTVVAMCSEFGRTARFNGTGGTDHGTGGLAILAGGLLANGKGGQAIANKWPGLGNDNLYENRDLLPTDDVRRYLAWLIAPMFNLSPDKIASTVFPGLAMESDLKLL
jgi:uncharacterized protein (DUF1501 family)